MSCIARDMAGYSRYDDDLRKLHRLYMKFALGKTYRSGFDFENELKKR